MNAPILLANLQPSNHLHEGSRVAILGCGSVGGIAAWSLASAGMTQLELADRDRLEAANLRRHVCGKSDLGRPKAEAVADFLRARFPQVGATPHSFCFLERPELLRSLIERCAIALVAVDGEAPKHLIDAMARELGRPMVYGGVYGDGWGAEVIFVDPPAGSPCYACTARALGRVGIPVSPASPDSAYALPDLQRDPSEWARADLTSILPCAALAARLVVAWLNAHARLGWIPARSASEALASASGWCGKTAHADIGRQRDSERSWREFGCPAINAWRLALRRVPEWELGPWELRPVAVQRLPDCPECGRRAGRS